MEREYLDIGSKPLLTIAIPTFNRASCLGQSLLRISEELDSLSAAQRKLVRVYVSNNASTDNTAEVIAEYQNIFPRELEVALNTENIGGERNVVQCYVSAKTPYVWVLGDDDAIVPGGLQMVLDVILEHDIDILYMPCRTYSSLHSDKYNNDSQCNKERISLYENPLKFVRRVNVNLTFISSLVVRTGRFSGVQVDAVKDSNLPQLGWVLTLLKEGKHFAIIENKIVAAKAANDGGYGLIGVFGNNLKVVAEALLKDAPELTKVILNSLIVDFFPFHIMELRKGKSDFDQEKNMDEELNRLFGKNWRYAIFIAPLLSLPLPLASPYNFLLKVLRRMIRPILI
jgi:glycosyltransferase involved in cell wall biosynthesis